MKNIVLLLIISCFFLVQCQKDETLKSDYSYAETYDYSGTVTAGDITIKNSLDTASLNKYVSAIPVSSQSSLQNLAKYLAAGTSNELQKAYVIYRWITTNITYNVAHTGTWKEESSEVVLANKTGVCEGYSQLFGNLATRMSLEAVKIHGYSKDYSYVPSDGISTDVGHAWNAVRIDGAWYLLDATWGAGYVSNATFHFLYSDIYFLMLPEAFLQMHYPKTTKWQLVTGTISFTEFEARYGSGFASGTGKYYYTNGDIYDGQWLEGKRSGMGTYYSSDGTKWVGTWFENRRISGKLYDANGNLVTNKALPDLFVEPIYQHR